MLDIDDVEFVFHAWSKATYKIPIVPSHPLQAFAYFWLL